MIVMDLSKPSSLKNIDVWIEEINSKADVERPVIMILATKKDLDISKRLITNKEIEDFQREHDQDIMFFEVSSRNGTNITEAFH